MAYKALIDSQLVLAFNQLKDLAISVTFVRKTAESFDFSAGASPVINENVPNVKCVILEESKDKSVLKREILFKSKELGEIGDFSEVQIEDEVWKIGPVIAQKRYVTLLTVYKE